MATDPRQALQALLGGDGMHQMPGGRMMPDAQMQGNAMPQVLQRLVEIIGIPGLTAPEGGGRAMRLPQRGDGPVDPRLLKQMKRQDRDVNDTLRYMERLWRAQGMPDQEIEQRLAPFRQKYLSDQGESSGKAPLRDYSRDNERLIGREGSTPRSKSDGGRTERELEEVQKKMGKDEKK